MGEVNVFEQSGVWNDKLTFASAQRSRSGWTSVYLTHLHVLRPENILYRMPTVVLLLSLLVTLVQAKMTTMYALLQNLVDHYSHKNHQLVVTTVRDYLHKINKSEARMSASSALGTEMPLPSVPNRESTVSSYQRVQIRQFISE